MKVSYNWLREYVDFELSPSKLADLLTMAGLEVKGIEEVGPHWKKVVVAQIESMRSHPQANHLSLCRVKAGEETYSIVCGAQNMKEGDKVALALVGSEIPHGMGIKKTKIRGEVSEGMMCSEAELGLSANADEIMILPPEALIGAPLADALKIHDHILEVSLTPNRGDCLSMIGIAREVAALTGGELHLPSTRILDSNNSRISDFVRVSVVDTDLCPRYCAALIRGVQIGSSPFWLRTRLERAGMRSINKVVDVTNYVMIEYGQPLHAFDFDRLEGGEIVVKRASEGEVFITLDGMERVLDATTLMICDKTRPVAIGGVMGGVNSEIEENTSTVLLESAYFAPTGIRRTSRVLGLQTESSYRFERGIDPEGVLPACLRAVALIVELTGGEAAHGVIDCYPTALMQPEIRLRLKRVNALLGMTLQRKEIEEILGRLRMEIGGNGDEAWMVTAPSYRSDITREIDIIEEIGRLKGYEHIPVEVPKMWIVPFWKRKGEDVERQAKEVLVGLGFYEVITYSFISPQSLRSLRLASDDWRLRPLVLLNPLTEEQSVMRTTLLPGLLEIALYNLSHKNKDLRIFELREIYVPKNGEKLPEERRSLSGLVMGAYTEQGWDTPFREVDFFDVKGYIERLFNELGTSPPLFTHGTEAPYIHPGKGGVIRLDGDAVGMMGELHPEVASAHGLPPTIYIFEIDMPPVLDHCRSDFHVTPLPRFPAVTRDVAVVVGEEVNAEQITQIIQEDNEGFMESVEVFDYYQGGQIPQGRKGLAFRIKFRSPERTLTDEEVNEFHYKVLERLETIPGLKIR